MSSAALQDLANRIATNTLTSQQQGALLAALDTIVPVFPNPDELSNSIPLFEEDLARLWYASLYSLNADGGIPLPPVVSDVTGTPPIVVTPVGSARVVSITGATDGAAGSMSAADKTKLDTLDAGVFSSVANAAALTAVVNASFPLGALAYVASYGAFFAMQPAQALSADVILAAADGRTWERTVTAVAVQTAKQAAVFIDPAAGNNQATGLTSGTAWKTFSEYVRRLGTRAPMLRQSTVITFVSSQVDNTDPVIFAPLVGNQATVSIVGVLGVAQQIATGVLSNVTAKNRTTGQLLLAQSGATAPQQLVQNNTKSSRAWTYAVNAGAVFKMTQPMLPQVIPATDGVPSALVDTWANGDSVTVYQPIAVHLVSISATLADLDQTTFQNLLYVVNLVDLSPQTFDTTIIQGAVYVAECDLSAKTLYSASGTSNIDTYLSNNLYSESLCDVPSQAPLYFGGAVISGGTGLLGYTQVIDGDIILGADSVTTLAFGIVQGSNTIGYVFIDTGASLNVLPGGNVVCGVAGFFPGTGVVYGPGVLNPTSTARLRFSGLAATCFKCVLQINNVTTAQAYSTAAGTGVWNGPRNLTPAQLDTTVAGGGFGGTAITPGGASISNAA